MTALGYLRRSKKSEAQSVSLAVQEAAIQRYAAEHGMGLVRCLADDGVSGGRRERLTRLDAAIRATGARVVIAYHLDRMARDAAGLLDWLERAARRGVELHVVGRGRVEAQSAAGYLVAGIEGVVAAHYRKVISEKTRDALARLKATGRRYSGRLPYGSRLGVGGQLEPDPSEIKLCEAAAAKSGRSLRQVSHDLAQAGILARNGRPLAPSTLLALRRRGDGPPVNRKQ